MCERDTPTGQSRIDFSKEKVKLFASEADKLDPDGVDYFTFGSKITSFIGLTVEKAHELINSLKANECSTNTAGLITAMYDRMKQLRASGVTDHLIAFIITDGDSSDREAVKTVLRAIADEQPDGEGIGFTFLRVGSDQSVVQFLTDLDDNLNTKFDIVDTKVLEDVDFEAAAMGALHD
jgi:hypothetical protein